MKAFILWNHASEKHLYSSVLWVTAPDACWEVLASAIKQDRFNKYKEGSYSVVWISLIIGHTGWGEIFTGTSHSANELSII